MRLAKSGGDRLGAVHIPQEIRQPTRNSQAKETKKVPKASEKTKAIDKYERHNEDAITFD